MIISEKIKISTSIEAWSKEILDDLMSDRKPGKKFWYAVTTTPSPENILYILPSMELKHDYYHEKSLRVVGLAGSWPEACEIVRSLVEEGIDQLGDLKNYMEQY